MTVSVNGTTGVSLVQDDVIVTADIQNSAVTTAKIADANITTAKLATAALPFGYGQSYSDVTSSRALSTTYTNSTSRAIFVSVLGGGNATMRAYVDGVEVQRCVFTTTNTNTNVAFIVPPSSTYSVTLSSGAIALWTELR